MLFIFHTHTHNDDLTSLLFAHSFEFDLPDSPAARGATISHSLSRVCCLVIGQKGRLLHIFRCPTLFVVVISCNLGLVSGAGALWGVSCHV
jgi:hypothetical protein